MSSRKRIHPAVMEVLKQSEAPWEIRNGRRHFHIRVDGRLAAVVPRDGGKEADRHLQNILAQVRRATGVGRSKG